MYIVLINTYRNNSRQLLDKGKCLNFLISEFLVFILGSGVDTKARESLRPWLLLRPGVN